MFDLPKEISFALDALEKAGFDAYLVGGAVRDTLMGKPAHDYDITTAATPEETEAVFSGFRVVGTSPSS